MPKVTINQKAPGFALKDFNGNEISLASFKDKKNILIVFNRGFM